MRGGELLFVGFEGRWPDARERRILKRLQAGGIVLLPRNLAPAPEGEGELRALVAELRALCPHVILAIDAEGGPVDRLRRIVAPAPAAADLARHPPALAERAGRWIGASLRAFDLDLDFAPVVDLDHGIPNNALDHRCLGSDPREVIRRAERFIGGLTGSGVGACLKHWPGLGAAPADTHLAPARIELPARDLERDQEPFRRLADLAGAVMVGHAIYPELDSAALPATMSPRLATDCLRRIASFDGVLFSDDLEMGALAPYGELPDRGEAALAAGCDALLFCRQLEEAPAIARRLARRGLAARREEALGRLDRFRRRLRRLRRGARAAPSLAVIRRRLVAVTAAATG